MLGAENFRALAEANRIRKVPVLAPRGRLFDREGRLLVDNYPSVSCYLLREQVKDLNADLPLISQGLHIPVDQIQATLRRFQIAPKYQPIPLKQDITPDEQAFIEAHRNELPELETLDEQRRLYPRDGFAAHLIGYVGEVSEDRSSTIEVRLLLAGRCRRKSGVEQTYDALLRGSDGSRDVIVNSHGKEIGHLGQTLAIPGKDLKLTIDLDIQMAAEKALEGKIGAIVAMDPHTGEILALASRPTFDPNQFSVRLTQELLERNPQQSRPPAAEQDDTGAARTRQHVQDHHVRRWTAGERRPDHARRVQRRGYRSTGTSSRATSTTAWSTSTTPFRGPATLSTTPWPTSSASTPSPSYATSLGFSQKTGIDLPDEVSGTMPSTAWKMKNSAREVVSRARSSRSASVREPSPRRRCKLARALSGIASGGVLRRPHVVFPGRSSSRELSAIHETFPGSGDTTIPLTTENWQIITDAMASRHHHRHRCCRAPGGHRLRRQDRHRPGREPQRRRHQPGHRKMPAQRLVRRHGPAPQPRYRRRGPLGARRLGSGLRTSSPHRSSTLTSRSSASARTTSASPRFRSPFQPRPLLLFLRVLSPYPQATDADTRYCLQ